MAKTKFVYEQRVKPSSPTRAEALRRKMREKAYRLTARTGKGISYFFSEDKAFFYIKVVIKEGA